MRPGPLLIDSLPSPPQESFTHPHPTIDVAAISDIGLRRSNNEDCFGYDLESGLFVVCDGVGGHSAGEVASRLAVDHVLLHYNRLRSQQAAPDSAFFQSILHANRMVWAAAQEYPDLHGMGTTLVAACLQGTQLLIANVGDSRAYFLRGDRCLQITQDHVTDADQARSTADHISANARAQNQLTETSVQPSEDAPTASHSPAPPLITRALGAAPGVDPDIFTADLLVGDTVLLTTDGLTRYADPEVIAHTICQSSSLAVACRSLLDIATRNGAEDNVTCLLLRTLSR